MTAAVMGTVTEKVTTHSSPSAEVDIFLEPAKVDRCLLKTSMLPSLRDAQGIS